MLQHSSDVYDVAACLL